VSKGVEVALAAGALAGTAVDGVCALSAAVNSAITSRPPSIR